MPPGDYRKDADLPFMTDEPPGPVPPERPETDIDDEKRNRMIWFVNYYIHQVNLMRYLMGEDYSLTSAGKHYLSCESVSGINGILEIEPYNTSIDWQEHALVCFEKGWIRIDLTAPLATQLSSSVSVYRDRGKKSELTTPMLLNICAMRNQAKNFLLALNSIQPAPCISEEAVRDLQIAEDYIEMTSRLGETKKPYHLRNQR